MRNGRVSREFAVVLLLFSVSLILPAGAAEPELDPLDAELLQGLSNELLEGIDAPAKPKGASDEHHGTAPKRAMPDGAAKGRRSAAAGEDVGRRSESDPLVQVAEGMRTAEDLLRQQNSGEPTQKVQDEVVAQLDALIQRKKEQCQACAAGAKKSSSKSQPQTAQKKSSKPAGNTPSGDPMSDQARDSTEELREQQPETPSQEDLEQLAKKVWGQLPERARGHIPNSSVEQFLPEYQDLLQRYYRRLAEQSDRRN